MATDIKESRLFYIKLGITMERPTCLVLCSWCQLPLQYAIENFEGGFLTESSFR